VDDLVLESPTLRVEIPRARLDLGITTLTGGALSIRSLEVDEPRILFRASASPAPGAPSAPTRPVLVERVVVRGGEFTLEQADLGGPVRIHGLDLEGSIGSGSLDVRVAGAEWARPSPLALGPAHASLRVSPLLALELDSFDAGTARSRIHASGSLGSVAAMRPDLRFQADLDLAEVSVLAGQAVASGRLGSRAARLEPRRSGWTPATPDGVSAYGVSVDGGRMRVVHRGGETTISPVLDLLGGKLSGEARLSARRTSGELRAAGLDVTRLRAALAPTAPAAAGRLDARMTWSGDPERDVPLRLRWGAEVRTETLRALRVDAEAEGRALPKSRRVDLDWSSSVEADGGAESLLATLALRAEGALHAGASLAYDGRASGTATLRMPAGARDLALQVQADGQSSRLTASAEVQGLDGTVALEAEIEGPKLRRLELRGTGLDLASAVPDTAGTANLVESWSSTAWRSGAQAGSTSSPGGRPPWALGWTSGATRGPPSPPARSGPGGHRGGAAHRAGHAQRQDRSLSHSAGVLLQPLSDAPRGPSRAAWSSAGHWGPGEDAGRGEHRVGRRGGAMASRCAAGPMKLAWADARSPSRPRPRGRGLRLQAQGAVAASADAGSSFRASGSLDLARLPLPEPWRVAARSTRRWRHPHPAPSRPDRRRHPRGRHGRGPRILP
jgi:hypothetical protein